jgi:succinate dehydrogenase / fumarate reductase flavoprotein subunit
VFAWEFQGDGQPPKLHREQLNFETVHLAQRSYK